MGEPDAPPRDPTNELIDDEFDLASQLLLFNRTDGIANGSNSDDNNSNDEGPLLTKRQRF